MNHESRWNGLWVVISAESLLWYGIPLQHRNSINELCAFSTPAAFKYAIFRHIPCSALPVTSLYNIQQNNRVVVSR
jgi:hypothetical protein